MKRGRRPSIGNAFVNTFAAGMWLEMGLYHASAVELAAAFGFIVLGPFAWFVGRP